MSDTIIAQNDPNFHTQPDMRRAARWYAEVLGYYVLPLHEPLFNDKRGYVCTCEPYRHSPLCKQRDEERKAKGQQLLYLEPHQHCENPGKHPRGLEHGLKDATNDPDKIDQLWGKYPTANIGHVPGRANLVMLDGDKYKTEYAGDEMALTADELRTQTALSGNLGDHLYYRKHDGATYTNAAGTLPKGVDVRGDNGYAVLPPSLHASGRRYQWKEGHNPRDLAPQLLPQRIHDVLVAASAKTARCSANFSTPMRWDGVPSTTAPDLAKWKLSVKTRGMIAQPAAKGQRSEHDAKVVQALVYAGAADDDILGVFEHHPVGKAGKFAEGGRRYLERTISAARAYAEEHPRPPAVDDTIAKARAWVHSIDFADYVAEDKQCSAGYRTREPDLAVATAILDVLEQYGSLEGPIGLRQLRALCNFGCLNTAARALDRLTPWFVRSLVSDDDNGANSAHRYELTCYAMESTCVDDTRSIGTTVLGVSSTQEVYSAYRHHDAFTATTTPIAPDSDKEYSTRYTLTDEYRRRARAILPAAGRTALVIVNALAEAGGFLPMRELVGLGGRKASTISRAVKRLAMLDLVTIGDDHGVNLRENWPEWLENVTELMPTAGLGKRRIVKDAQSTLTSCAVKEKEAQEAGTAVPGWVAHRKRRAEMELIRLAPVFWRLQKTQIGAAPLGHVHTGPNGQLLEEQLPELREWAYRRAA